ncbi:MAG: nucleotidyltransferase family protein [Flavobacterium sp.]
MKDKTAIVILAAGNSSRLGKPKQLLSYKNTSLLKNTISQGSLVQNTVIIVVTGANHELAEREITASKATVIFNPDWQSGMSTSISKGLTEILRLYPEIEKCIFSVCDQPFVTTAIFENLISEHNITNNGIVASAYSETLGTPVLFHKKYFNELLNLKGQEGAKKIINKFHDDTTSISFEKGNIDIDTEEDYLKLIS